MGLSALVAVIGSLALASGASARVTRTVIAGQPPDTQQVDSHYVSKNYVAKYSPDINAFFNHRTVIHVGDSVRFKIHGFHTIDLPGKSGQDLPFVTPTGQLVTGANDAAGHPFWFNGLPQLGINPALFAGAKSHRYKGTKRIDSGIGSSKLPVKFTKPGRYKFFCDVHPGMIGYIVVRGRHRRIPSRAQAAATGLAQLKADILSAINLSKYKSPKDTVSIGNSARNGVELYAMFPKTLRGQEGGHGHLRHVEVQPGHAHGDLRPGLLPEADLQIVHEPRFLAPQHVRQRSDTADQRQRLITRERVLHHGNPRPG
jgi:plastocyanin